LETIVDRTSHAVADLFGVVDRGYVREGYYADLVLVDAGRSHTVEASNLLYKCHWSPFEGHTFSASIHTTLVNGTVVYRDGRPTGDIPGQRLEFNRGR
jgi:dihydroorotase